MTMELLEHVLPSAAHLGYMVTHLALHTRTLEMALRLKQEAGYPDIYNGEAATLVEAGVSVAYAGLPEVELTQSLNSSRECERLLQGTETHLETTEDGRLVGGFLRYVARLKPRSKKELARFFEEEEERMWAVLSTGKEGPEVKALYRVSDEVAVEFGLRGAHPVEKSP